MIEDENYFNELIKTKEKLINHMNQLTDVMLERNKLIEFCLFLIKTSPKDKRKELYEKLIKITKIQKEEK